MFKKLFSVDPARIGRFDGPAMSDAVPASLVDGTPGDLKAELIALLGKENVFHRVIDLVRYASDASPYRLVPQVVVLPQTTDDVVKLFRYCRETGRHATFRAAGTSLNGQSLSDDILIDVRRHWPPSDVIGSVTVSDAQIQQEYDSHKATYVVPEKRDIQQIEFKTEKEATDARAGIDKGMNFDELATRRGLSPAQLSLGSLTQAELPDPDRAKAIFALPENQVSQPLKGAFGGYVLARVTKITPGSNKTLADVKDDIKKALTTALAANKLVDAVNAYTDARSGGSDLKEAAKKAGMKLGHLSAVDATGLGPSGTKTDAPADPEFLPAVFKTEVGEDSDPFPTKAGAYFTVHVNGVTPPKLKPLDQVRVQATADWTNDQRSKLLATKALTLTAQAEKDKSLDNVARDLKVSVQHSPALTRQTNDTMFAAAFVQRLFDAPAGAIVSGAQGTSGNYILARVSGIAHPRLNPRDPGFQGGAARLSQAVAGDFSIAMANAGRERQGVKVNQKIVASVTGNQ